jgi:cell division protein FtsB
LPAPVFAATETMPSSSTSRRAIPSRPSRWRWILLLLLLGLSAYAVVGGGESIFELRRQERTLAAMEMQVAQLRAENDSLRQVLERLEVDLEYIEKVAREEYGMIKPGERLYRVRHRNSEQTEE